MTYSILTAAGGLVIAAFLSLLLFGCDSMTAPDLHSDYTTWSDHHCKGGHAGAPECAPPGNGDGNGSATAALAEGLDAAAQAVSVKRDNANTLLVESSSYEVRAQLANTQAHASDAETTCVFDFGGVAASQHGAVRAQLIDMLERGSSNTLNLSIEIDKNAFGAESLGHVISTTDDNSARDYWLTIGKNNGADYFGFPTVTVDGDAYTFTGGTTRTIVRVQQGPRPRGNDPVAQMRCPNLDTVIATIVRGS